MEFLEYCKLIDFMKLVGFFSLDDYFAVLREEGAPSTDLW